jgi:hypothetical protein
MISASTLAGGGPLSGWEMLSRYCFIGVQRFLG